VYHIAAKSATPILPKLPKVRASPDDQGFFESFHDSADDFMGAFVDGCFKALPQIMAQHNKKLTGKMLYQQDMQTLG